MLAKALHTAIILLGLLLSCTSSALSLFACKLPGDSTFTNYFLKLNPPETLKNSNSLVFSASEEESRVERLGKRTPAFLALKALKNDLNHDDCFALKSHLMESGLVLLLNAPTSLIMAIGIEVSRTPANEPVRYYRIKIPNILSPLNLTPTRSVLAPYFIVLGSTFLHAIISRYIDRYPRVLTLFDQSLYVVAYIAVLEYIRSSVSNALR